MTTNEGTIEAELLELAERLYQTSRDMMPTDPENAAKFAAEARSIMRDLGRRPETLERRGPVERKTDRHNGSDLAVPELEDEQAEADLSKLLALHRNTVGAVDRPLDRLEEMKRKVRAKGKSWQSVIASWGLIALGLIVTLSLAT